MNLMTSYCSTAHTRTDTCMLIHTHTHNETATWSC